MKHDRLAFDRATVRTIDSDGRMRVEVTNISKANVCPYLGSEIPDAEALGLDAATIYMILRDPVELAKAADSFNNLPLLSSHVPVSADDHRPDLVVGATGTDAVFNPPYLQNSLIIWSAAAIAGVTSGQQKELSSAYRYRAVKESGTYEGEKYDLRMVDIVGNHLALVEVGRAGPDVVVSDENPFKGIEMTKKQRLIAATAGARVALSGLMEKDADMSLLDKTLAKLAQDAAEPDGDEPKPEPKKPVAEDESDDELYEDDPDNAGKRRKKVVAAADAEEDDKAEKTAITKAAMDAAINAAVTAATKSTMDRMESLHVAREEVAPLVGKVALDSAEAVYKFALDHAKVDVAGVHPSAYRALVKMIGAPKAVSPVYAQDAAATVKVVEQFPNLARFGH